MSDLRELHYPAPILDPAHFQWWGLEWCSLGRAATKHKNKSNDIKADGTRITYGNTKRITSGNIQKSHTPHTLDAHFGQHGFHHFGQHGKHRSYHHYLTQPFRFWFLHHYLTQPFRVWFGGEGSFYLHHYLTQPFRVCLGGRGHSTYIIAWLSHLGFGWGGGVILLTSLLDSAI